MLCRRPPGNPDAFEIAVLGMALFNKNETLVSFLQEVQFHGGPWVTDRLDFSSVRAFDGIYYPEVLPRPCDKDIHLLEIAMLIEESDDQPLFDQILGSGISLDGLWLSSFIYQISARKE